MQIARQRLNRIARISRSREKDGERKNEVGEGRDGDGLVGNEIGKG